MRTRFRVTNQRLAWLSAFGLLLCLGLAGGQPAATENPAVRGRADIGALQFAIADLDGDLKPDLASVEVENQQASPARYGIRLQFGGGADSYIGVTGPFGGLRLAIRDVNGDDNLDLVLTSMMDRRVIQVLLNDGHGKFAVAGNVSVLANGSEPEFGLGEREAGPADRMALTGARTSFDADMGLEHRSISDGNDDPLAVPSELLESSSDPDKGFGRAPPLFLTVS